MRIKEAAESIPHNRSHITRLAESGSATESEGDPLAAPPPLQAY